MAKEKIAYIYGQEIRPAIHEFDREIIPARYNPKGYDFMRTINGEVKTSGGGHMASLGITVEELKKQRYQIVQDQNYKGESLPLPKEVKSELEGVLAK